MTLDILNNLPLKQLRLELCKCCGSSKWIKEMTRLLPFENLEQIKQNAMDVWETCSEVDWLEAFSYHPRIGEKEIEEKFSSTAGFAKNEQAAVGQASKKVISELAELNNTYFQKFGFIFIIFATGKSAQEMLLELKIRIKNERETEIKIAADEQLKITLLRIEKMLNKQ
ncbi:MAG: 2-oxo-4-hydroxy-4-carboxy-5-ureidoimidazoline decarboxylase [Calditrichaeota bacterium]|nr:MAG: 2-oxo-4-hydroxy-4-carboxy-5-ureidoimidazoline decarboxylase [Calditrichota bacterium]MBL1205055.1 2-oxo-4-hydroxy-4-carboxy-5-ureidoimidazoline decarboxylase [Calditrichota bacterium]NOG44885.1 2-oxo-4-hydroxy-4-carboxy-5-ureidoimidazoline decarboxylase [Calditrichota bacterium]